MAFTFNQNDTNHIKRHRETPCISIKGLLSPKLPHTELLISLPLCNGIVHQAPLYEAEEKLEKHWCCPKSTLFTPNKRLI